MRIDEKDIQTALAKLLTDAGFKVFASEEDEGFTYPAVFLSVFPAEAELEGAAMEHVTDAVTIAYLPDTDTVEECADAARRLRDIIMYKPIDVKDRRLTVEAVSFETESYILYAGFDLSYYQETPPADEEYDEMNELVLGGDI